MIRGVVFAGLNNLLCWDLVMFAFRRKLAFAKIERGKQRQRDS